MKKLVAAAASGLMIAGGVLISAPAASAYPAGYDPAVRIIGTAGLQPGDSSMARAFYFMPVCMATMTITRSGSNDSIVERTRVIGEDGSAAYPFRAPKRPGLYVVKIKQVKTTDCAGFSDTAKFRVLG
jgi:hypothetical protein